MYLDIPKKLSPERNGEFRKLYREHYGVELTSEEADNEAHRLMTFIYLVLRYNEKVANPPKR